MVVQGGDWKTATQERQKEDKINFAIWSGKTHLRSPGDSIFGICQHWLQDGENVAGIRSDLPGPSEIEMSWYKPTNQCTKPREEVPDRLPKYKVDEYIHPDRKTSKGVNITITLDRADIEIRKNK